MRMAAAAVIVVFLVASMAAAQETVTLRYYGHSFFLLSAGGLRIAIDPYGQIGYPLPEVEGDVVVITHEHGDHNNVGLIRGTRRVFRGLVEGARDWRRIYERIDGTLIYSVPSFHDGEFGTSARGLNSIFVVETHGVRFVHLGDLGHVLSEGQVRALGRVDVLMIPVGGAPFTTSVADATQVVAQLQPRLVIPMHYKTAVRPTWPGSDEQPFLAGKGNVRRLGAHTLIVSRDRLPTATQIVVMDYR